MTSHREWFERVTEGWSLRAIAKELGSNHGSLTKWIDNDELTADRVITISYICGADPVQALIDTGHLHREKDDTPAQVAARVREDLAKLEAMAERAIEQDAEVIDFPVRPSPYDEMPEDAAAYGGELFDTPHDDDDY